MGTHIVDRFFQASCIDANIIAFELTSEFLKCLQARYHIGVGFIQRDSD